VNEAAFQSAVLATLAPHFHVQREVGGTHFTGQRFALDAIVRPRITASWKNSKIALGIEFKDEIRLSGDTRNFTQWLAQCVDYSNTEWDEYGYIHIFACPSLVEGIPACGEPEAVATVMNRVMGQLGLGELKRLAHYGLSFTMHGQHRIWSQNRGVEEGRRWTMERVFGSR